jgi:hypothetical protein
MPKHKKRLRGKPRRGSPWRPRRPEAPPSAHPTEIETTRIMALVPQLHSSAWRMLHPLPMTDSPRPPSRAPPSSPATQHPPTSQAYSRENCASADSLRGEQLREKISILHGLVFDLRQGVDDLRFRLEANTEKLDLFLQLLSALQAAVPTHSTEETAKPEPMDDYVDVQTDKRQEPGATTRGEATEEPPSTEPVKQRAEHELGTESTAKENTHTGPGSDEKAKDYELWGDGTAIVEEEPWPGDLQGTWQGYASTT